MAINPDTGILEGLQKSAEAVFKDYASAVSAYGLTLNFSAFKTKIVKQAKYINTLGSHEAVFKAPLSGSIKGDWFAFFSLPQALAMALAVVGDSPEQIAEKIKGDIAFDSEEISDTFSVMLMDQLQARIGECLRPLLSDEEFKIEKQEISQLDIMELEQKIMNVS